MAKPKHEARNLIVQAYGKDYQESIARLDSLLELKVCKNA